MLSNSKHLIPALLVFSALLFGQADSATHCGRSTVAEFSASLEPKAEAFLATLQAAVQAVDSRKIALMVQYPLLVNTGKSQDNSDQRSISSC